MKNSVIEIITIIKSIILNLSFEYYLQVKPIIFTNYSIIIPTEKYLFTSTNTYCA